MWGLCSSKHDPLKLDNLLLDGFNLTSTLYELVQKISGLTSLGKNGLAMEPERPVGENGNLAYWICRYFWGTNQDNFINC